MDNSSNPLFQYYTVDIPIMTSYFKLFPCLYRYLGYLKAIPRIIVLNLATYTVQFTMLKRLKTGSP